MTRRIVILNSRPGMLRGGRAHPRRAVHDLTEFTPEQLAEIEAEPNFATHVFDEATPDPADGEIAAAVVAAGRAALRRRAG